ncbi:hypothetical protein N9A87_01775 [Euryarchaeota archaeon]|nr:hypothetical protein [Euryarchaeota archaeon]
MPLLQPLEEEAEWLYVAAACICWTSPLWYKWFSTALIEPLAQWSQLGLVFF